jgi:hypothetical protein
MRLGTLAVVTAAVLGMTSSAVVMAQTADKGGRHAAAQDASMSERMSDGLPYNNIEVSPEGVQYLAGGVGIEAQERFKTRADDFNLKLVFTLDEGAYIADVAVAVKDAKGRTMVEDVADGPFFLTKLPPGRYTVEARYDGKTVTRNVHVTDRSTRTAYLRWPSNPETDFIFASRP